MRIRKSRALSAALVVASLAANGFTQELHRFLKTSGTFSDAELSALDSGSVVVKILPSQVKNEMAILGTARIQATTEFFLRMYRDIERFETGWGVTKKLSDPPRIEDFAALELPPDDLKALQTCKVGDCELKVGEPGLLRLRREIDWSDPAAPARVNQFFRERALDYAKGYLEGGNATLAVYVDDSKPTAIADEFQGLLESSPYILSYRPELHRYLQDFPKASLPGAEGFLYWSLVDFGAKPVLRLNHVTIYPVGEGENGNVVIASKQLYFSHYFHTGLELYVLAQDAERPADGFYLVALNRYRTDLPSGLFGKMVVKTAQDSARGSVERYLTATKAAIDGYFRDERTRPK
ncbi:MAG: hypothetical protein ACRD1Z_06795 [Vicinamibacteria bacterium]